MSSRRDFLKKAGAVSAASATAIVGAPAIANSKKTIKWRLQTYAGPALGEHVIKPAVDAFNKAANGEMVIELFYADQLVPTGELFRAMQRGTIDAVQSDDDSIAAPVDISVFGGYFPFATRYSLDVPVLFEQYGLKEIWKEAYDEVKGVTWLSAGAWDPCHFATVKPIRSLSDLKGKRVFTFPTAGRFLSRFGVIPVTLPWEDVEVAIQTGELDGIAWSGITEDYTVGWADVTKYFLTNNISGAWCGSFFANSERWDALPEHLKTLWRLCMDSSHYYRQHWYWGGEAKLRVEGKKLELTTIPDEEWKSVEQEALKFWDEIAKTSPRTKRVVDIFKKYAADMEKAGKPYRYS
ncbi:putative TRAP-type C4-dicarboxylate transport system, periplasmic component [Vibrio nigripulchritudo MADA3029]|uniref:TRAP-type C4-dicarboxylate transport system, periplasmic component n=2 Tax=Vibrio nigripulchritudo TaxID=28173 RepID=A0AAV2VJE8_9VIBR|nr:MULTISPECIES: TRAP transporter substrate-binding protein DctP [Vibrio]EGU50428.1 TRAP dicarboxylate transporter subunit DctP [Vibrio nigripulchritudo ATCC 27043]KJY79820.1 C4-dicarboxylate ABC transporter [Vibrio nigripulchritudo]UAB71779.1 TRAP transporter substrate-binding protein DctP [Vibrio sp. SCSIO 43132]CCN33996.1 putative TRAP-type C4-dicarboxylate transport system, periplasmic component [Vibrio nigripulchritudo AM115]CCN41105.1 putative TRAP-type C4-dicarboxylate transport system,